MKDRVLIITVKAVRSRRWDQVHLYFYLNTCD